MARSSKPHPRNSRKSRPQRKQNARVTPHSTQKHTDDGEDWVGSPLLTAMDKIEDHIEEMFNTVPGPVSASAPAAILSTADTAAIKVLIKQEVTRRMEENLNDIIDTAITARTQQLEAARNINQKIDDIPQATYDRDRCTIDDLDALHRHEHVLNTALVQRLFQVSMLEDEPDARFEETTFGLQGTDSVISVLVSHVEALVLKVERMERHMERLQDKLK